MVWVILLLTFLLPVNTWAHETETLVFSMKDPPGDDSGAGNLRYPEHGVFESGLWDLVRFTVSSTPGKVYLDSTFQKVTNPFNAPEGYFHQRIEIYISQQTEIGSLELPLELPLTLDSEHGWEYRIQVAPFGNTKLEHWQDGVIADEIDSWLLEDGQTIRVELSKSLIGYPVSDWRYYVLVGSFDGLAPNMWRGISPHPSMWGLSGEDLPIVDVLAPSWGPSSQARQLSEGVLVPVGLGWQRKLPWYQVVVGLLMLLALFIWGIIYWQRARSNRYL